MKAAQNPGSHHYCSRGEEIVKTAGNYHILMEYGPTPACICFLAGAMLLTGLLWLRLAGDFLAGLT